MNVVPLFAVYSSIKKKLFVIVVHQLCDHCYLEDTGFNDDVSRTEKIISVSRCVDLRFKGNCIKLKSLDKYFTGH